MKRLKELDQYLCVKCGYWRSVFWGKTRLCIGCFLWEREKARRGSSEYVEYVDGKYKWGKGLKK